MSEPDYSPRPPQPARPNAQPPAPAYVPPYAPPSAAPQYAPPAGYAVPAQGYGPWTAQAPAPGPVASPPPGPAGLGLVAFLIGLAAAVIAPIVGAIAGFNVGRGTGRALALNSTDFDWSILTPVREWVLLGEVSFWVGTVLGIWALVQGIIAIVKRRGRGWGIAAVVTAVAGFILFTIVIQVAVTAGLAMGASAS